MNILNYGNNESKSDTHWHSSICSCVLTEVAYGAILTLKNSVTSGAYLHSHDHLYPEEIGGGQQQITTYAHKDENNQWHIKRHNKMPPSWNSTKPVDLVRHGDLLRLEHFVTGRNLHAHRVLAPITIKQFQVTGYGLVSIAPILIFFS